MRLIGLATLVYSLIPGVNPLGSLSNRLANPSNSVNSDKVQPSNVLVSTRTVPNASMDTKTPKLALVTPTPTTQKRDNKFPSIIPSNTPTRPLNTTASKTQNDGAIANDSHKSGQSSAFEPAPIDVMSIIIPILICFVILSAASAVVAWAVKSKRREKELESKMLKDPYAFYLNFENS